MTDNPETPAPPAGSSVQGLPPHAQQAPVGPVPGRTGVLRAPSARVTAALAAAMLGIGVAVGAAIGPAPSASLAGASRLPLLLPSLLSGAGAAGRSSAPTTLPAPAPAPATAAPATGTKAAPGASTAQTPASTSTSSGAAPPSEESTPSASSTPTSSGQGTATTLPPVTNVWLIQLAGTSFAEALAQPSAAPYIDTQATGAGTLLSGWSAIDGSAFANETALLASSPPQLVNSIVQPPCPEGAAGVQCAAGTPGALTAADEFLKATVATITSTVAYREHGLIVITLATVASGSATGLPSGASSATLTSQPPAGVLLISPFASRGARPSIAFNPSSPKQSLEKLLRQ